MIAEQGIFKAHRWSLRDVLAAATLFAATAAFVLWQNAHFAILWDISYILENSVRLAAGQVPYRDFPFVYPPITFAVQAAIMRSTGHIYYHHVLYAALAGGLGTVLTWRIVLRILPKTAESAWIISVLLVMPLSVLGIYSIFPHSFYDCDCTLAILAAVWMLQQLQPDASLANEARPGKLRGYLAGIILVLPLFIKQNIGLPFLLITVLAITSLLLADILRRDNKRLAMLDGALWCVLAGTVSALLAAVILIHFTCGIANYLHWTIHFAAERRLPGLSDMLGVYNEPTLLWTLPCIIISVAIAISPLQTKRWAHSLCLLLLSAPFVWIDLLLLMTSDSDDRAANLLALWPLLLIISIALTLHRLYKRQTLQTLLPLIVLATIHGTLLSQQLWGSTYSIWPLLILLIAEMLGFLAGRRIFNKATFLTPLSVILCITLVLCGGLYAASAERLSYAELQDGPLEHATLPALAGMSTRGTYLPELEQLIRFTDKEIPTNDGILLLPGEDPFYFATGRVPQFPLLMFDNTTDPYTPEQVVALAETHNIRWLIVKKNLQLTADPMPEAQFTLHLLLKEYIFYHSLNGYDIYRHR